MEQQQQFELDHSLLEGLSEEQRQEALATAEAARRAEERAEQRALERAMARKRAARQAEAEREKAAAAATASNNNNNAATSNVSGNSDSGNRLVFVPKRKRLKEDPSVVAAAAAAASNKDDNDEVKQAPSSSSNARTTSRTSSSTARSSQQQQQQQQQRRPADWTAKEFSAVQETYLGKKKGGDSDNNDAKKRKGGGISKKITFKFRWEDNEDTFADAEDPLYQGQQLVAAKLQQAKRQSRNDDGNNRKNTNKNTKMPAVVSTMQSVMNKPLDRMTPRDWRILRENYQISIKGGKTPPPMRRFDESPAPGEIPELHPALLDAIYNVLKFKEPSPIQRQAIPIGLQRRDLLGRAETGSGKTVAFGVPLCHYLLHLPSSVLTSVAAEGPLALIMAPTRELALQIDVEMSKLLSRQEQIKVAAIVGGQSIQQQAQVLRQGVHIVVGTPGRINDCIEMAYLVLNQCCYIVMDEADRMIDMGFAPQMQSILDAMGGYIKSENEKETYEQELQDLKEGGLARHRLTAMFSATMPMEVERLAKQYMRHPAIVQIGDKDSGKNSRIAQKIIFVPSVAQKERALRDLLLDRRFEREKVLVFVNEKRHADQVGRMVDRIMGRPCVVMHGGKSQEQREENLEKFRRGGVVMVATDVAGRGLDIPDVAHVINYDLPTRSIENYTHRIGRTGRAGKSGLATSLMTEEDQGIMAALKSYLESTGNTVPDKLARHPAASANSGGNSNLIY